MTQLNHASIAMERGWICEDYDRTGLAWMMASALITVILWQFPFGNYVLYPFTILATWFHEMAHGAAAMILGGRFTGLMIFRDGSGLAYYTGPLFLGPLGDALVAAAGPLGPAFAGAGLIAASRNKRASFIGLGVLGGVLILSALVWIRSVFGLAVIPLIGVGCLALAFGASQRTAGFAVQFLGVQACICTYNQLGYLFSYSSDMGLSDTGKIQKLLILPYWFWGAAIAVASFVILVQSLRFAYNKR